MIGPCLASTRFATREGVGARVRVGLRRGLRERLRVGNAPAASCHTLPLTPAPDPLPHPDLHLNLTPLCQCLDHLAASSPASAGPTCDSFRNISIRLVQPVRLRSSASVP